MGSTSHFHLGWHDYESSLCASFKDLRQSREFFDVSLYCDEGTAMVQAHKVILAACSPLFRKMLARSTPQQSPVIYLKGVDHANLTAVINFMYHGEVSVANEQLSSFLRIAKELAVKGLTGDGGPSSSSSSPSVPAAQRKRGPMVTPQQSSAFKKRKTEEESRVVAAAAKAEEDAAMEDADAEVIKTVLVDESNIGIEDKLEDEEEEEEGLEGEGEVEEEEAGGAEGEEEEQVAEGLEEEEDTALMAGEVSEYTGADEDEEEKKEWRSVEDFIEQDAEGHFWCNECGKKTSTKPNMKQHVEALHYSPGYPCTGCQAQFNTRKQLKRHTEKCPGK